MKQQTYIASWGTGLAKYDVDVLRGQVRQRALDVEGYKDTVHHADMVRRYEEAKEALKKLELEA